MDSDRFDALTRSLSAAGTRRHALLAALGGAIGALGLAEVRGAKSGKCKPKCGKCLKCQKGDCDKKHGKKRCKRGRCVANPPGTVPCGSACVDTSTDPRNCGACGKRCQLNATCQGGICGCVKGACPANSGGPGGTCCPVANTPADLICRCAPPANIDGELIDPTTCLTRNPAGADPCPAAQRCIGPNCMACCPVGATCDTSTGTCLQN